VWEPEGKGPLVRHRYRREENIKVVLKEMVWKGLDWIYLAEDSDRGGWAVVITVMKP
jgi:hypothetical protein